MKKTLSIVLIVIMVAALAVGCAPKAAPAAAEPAATPAPTEAPAATPAAAEQPAPAAGAFKDGTYTEKGKTDERGWTPQIEITVKDGKIAAVKYDEFSADNKKKSEDAGYKDAFKKSKNVDLVAAYEALQNSLVEKQEASKVDAFSGATSTSKTFVELATKALAQAK